jgi:succinate-semialdehyde dehydrogenase/glutarate-semialdehyde dehydrogenase
MSVIDPATDQEIGLVACAETEDLESAAQSVARGFEIWRKFPAMERQEIMYKAATFLRQRVNEISWIMTKEEGKPLKESYYEILKAASMIEWFAEEGKRAYGKIIPSRHFDVMQFSFLRPVGPVAAFTPWNFPINQVVRKLCGALAAGCSIVIKAPEETPASPAALVQTFLDAGVPESVIALVYGCPEQISDFLISHPIIQKISFTGSTSVGKRVASLAGRYMKRSTMELGGHAPVLVFDDADLDEAVSILVKAKLLNSGQVCISPTRFLIQDRIFPAFLENYIALTETIKVGNGIEKGVDMGPLANKRRIPFLKGLIFDALEKGAILHCGNVRIGVTGNFFKPTVLTNVPIEARIMNEEPFGPVSIINRFSTIEEAVSEANRLRFGLASYAFTQSIERFHIISTEVNVGMMTINHNGLSFPELPFGGMKDSGYGTEGGSQAIDAYLETKLVTFASC